MLKRILISFVFLSFIFSFSQPSMASAAESDACDGALFSGDDEEEWENRRDDKDLAEKFMISQLENLSMMGTISSLPTLVFDNPYCIWAGEELSSNGVFTNEEKEKIIDPVFGVIAVIYSTVITLAIMISALKLGFNATSPQGRADFWRDVMYWVFSALFIAGFTTFTDLLFGMNMAIVNTFESMTPGTDDTFIMTDFNPFLWLAEWVLTLALNFIYIARKIIILLLMIMGVVAAASLIFAKTRYFFGVWLKELVGNIFLQSIHAIILFSFATMASTDASEIFKLGMLIMFIPVTGMISKWLSLGDSSSKLGSTLTMTGLAGVGGAVMLTKKAGSVIRGGGPGGGESANGNSSSNPFGSTAKQTERGGGADTAPTSISTKASGSGSRSWELAKTGAEIFGTVAGGVAGSVLGPGGVVVGAGAGGALARGGTQFSRNVAGSAAGTGRTLADAYKFGKESKENGGSGFKENWTNLEQRRKIFGMAGESAGSLLSWGGTSAATAGKSLGQMASGVSQKRLMETSQERGGFALADGRALTPDTLQESYGGKDAMWVQNKDHSYFALKNDDGTAGKRITPYGAGDTSLKGDTTRYMDYKVGRAPMDAENIYNEATSTTQQQTQKSPIVGVNGIPINSQPTGRAIVDTTGTPISSNTTTNLSSELSTPISSGATAPVQSNTGIQVQPNAVTSVQSNTGTPEQPSTKKGENISPQRGMQQGSSFNFQRQSDVYTISSSGEKMFDTGMKPANINPDTYVSHASVEGRNRTKSDRGADLTHMAAETTREKAQQMGAGFGSAGEKVSDTAGNIGSSIHEWNIRESAWADNYKEVKEENYRKRGREWL
ncbi:hypothetical protein QTG56_23870 (plasmid) [Rossellomorea sp. AcN35-11]|nr:hypothetical protein [Rossellomorea aquimaris]WJV32400.1 hypothetical protein QTG56_23870 [Rossellomorea sp. AcN35-11]